MKRICFCFVLLCLLTPSLASPQTSRSRNTGGDKSWQQFYAELQNAVRKRDRAALREMMPPDFVYNCCDSIDSNGNGETRDEAFRDWDNPKVRGWSALNRVLAQGVVPESGWLVQSNNKLPRRVAPPQAVKGKYYRNWIAEFELRQGRWYFISFQVPEND